jgi:hypothetical protein
MTVFSLDWYASIVGKTMNHVKEKSPEDGPDIPFLRIVDPCQDRHICARYAKET